MCVIIHTMRKDLLKRRELNTAMENNPSGFFIAELLKNGKRNVIRTTSADEAREFWESIPDSHEVVMHFRVPSKGVVSEANVHGWSQDKILFCHNKTFHSLLPLMSLDACPGTDSEYFFKKVFIPLYRKLGGYGKAYKNEQLCPLLNKMVFMSCYNPNKILFVMPDNVVLKYGVWEGDDPGRPGFYASNMSYCEPKKKKREGILSAFLGMFRR